MIKSYRLKIDNSVISQKQLNTTCNFSGFQTPKPATETDKAKILYGKALNTFKHIDNNLDGKITLDELRESQNILGGMSSKCYDI